MTFTPHRVILSERGYDRNRKGLQQEPKRATTTTTERGLNKNQTGLQEEVETRLASEMDFSLILVVLETVWEGKSIKTGHR